VDAAVIAKVQFGAVKISAASGNVTPTLAAGSAAGNLLAATLTTTTGPFAAPAGWVKGPVVSNTGVDTEIWYYPGNPGGISSAAFTSPGTNSIGELSEWSGVAAVSPLDKSGTATATGVTSATVSTSASVNAAGEMGITAFGLSFGSTQTVTFTAGVGWTKVGSTGAGSAINQYVADYRLSLATGTASELETANKSGNWAAAIATFIPAGACAGGGLSLTSPATVGFPGVTLTGLDQTTTTTAVPVPSDMTGTLNGWKLQGTSTTFVNAASQTLPTNATTVTAASAAAAAGNCSLPTNSVGYPVTLPAGSPAPAAVKLYNAAVGTGGGPANVTLTVVLAIPGNAYKGSYSSTWTFSIASGP
jgi:hypothetical protein